MISIPVPNYFSPNLGFQNARFSILMPILQTVQYWGGNRVF